MKNALMVFFSLLVLLSRSQQAQNDSTMFLSEQKWQEMVQGIDYSENFEDGQMREISDHSSGFNFDNFKYVIYALVLGLVTFLTIRVFKNFGNNVEAEATVNNIETVEDIDEKIHEIDLEELIEKAMRDKNYRIALRLNFLIIIKLLTLHGKIEWAKEKTNWEYYSELREKLLADQFKEVIRNFESVWYGEYPLTELQYQMAEPLYKAMQKKLKPNE